MNNTKFYEKFKQNQAKKLKLGQKIKIRPKTTKLGQESEKLSQKMNNQAKNNKLGQNSDKLDQKC